MKHLTGGILFVLFCVPLFLIGCGGKDDKKDNVFTIGNGVLYRGDNEWRIQSVENSYVAAAGTPYEVLAKFLHQIADVGANTICVDFMGIAPDGKSINPEFVSAVATVIHEATERHMGTMCRVFVPGFPADAELRMNAARTAAEAFKNIPQAVYLFDGPAAGKAAAVFSQVAPNLIVASPAGSAITLVTSEEAALKNPLSLFAGKVSPNLASLPHFVVPDLPETCPQLDEALADPIEKQPWTPDNSVLSEQERAEGWIALFDGKTLNGWTLTGKNMNGWKISNGVLEWAEDGGGLVRSRDRYENFILRLDWKIDAGGNSGVMLRAPRVGRASRIGMEIQIEGDYGELASNDSTGAVYVQSPPLVAAQKPNGEWNSYDITLNGPMLKVVLNGQVVQDINLDTHPDLALRLHRGFIALQDHHNHVCFRNVRLKPL